MISLKKNKPIAEMTVIGNNVEKFWKSIKSIPYVCILTFDLENRNRLPFKSKQSLFPHSQTSKTKILTHPNLRSITTKTTLTSKAPKNLWGFTCKPLYPFFQTLI
jgi:hypothetical protein